MSKLSKVTRSRNQWRGKTTQSRTNNRYLRREIARVKTQRDQLKRQLKASQRRLDEFEKQAQSVATAPKVDGIWLALRLFLEVRISFRAVSRVLSLLAAWLGLAKAPCPQTVINWVMRLSIVRLEAARELRGLPLSQAPFSNGLIWMIDLSINEMDPPLCGSTSMSQNEFKTSESIQPQEASPMKQEMSVLGIDIAKRVFHAVGSDETGKIVFRKRLSRQDLMPFIAKLPPMLIGMEACGGAHYWARRFREHGHEVKLMAPQFVKPYVKSNKNDMRDAEGIGEAVTRPTMRFVPTKEVDQQDIQALHRVRERLMAARTALINEVHGLMNEYGIVIPKGVSKFRKAVVGKLESEKNKLTPLSQEMFWKLIEEFAALEEQLAYYQDKLETLATTHPESQRLMTIPGIGPITATALLAAISDASAFKNGRQLAAWLGLVPRQHSTGGKEQLLGISKRGDRYLRKLLVHGARAVVRTIGDKADRRSGWIRTLVQRRGFNRATVAVANKNARIVWALLRSHQEYQPAMG